MSIKYNAEWMYTIGDCNRGVIIHLLVSICLYCLKCTKFSQLTKLCLNYFVKVMQRKQAFSRPGVVNDLLTGTDADADSELAVYMTSGDQLGARNAVNVGRIETNKVKLSCSTFLPVSVLHQ